ncbi:MAG: T9SS type A sorting domain-containing protein, partial [Flavobacteriaceae bacterium]|nr:T9SS type A sorting domain-containing protein [Flavobacteriaceae bacterium]
VTVTAPPTLVLSGTTATICAESSSAPVTVSTGASSYTNYVWSTPTTVTGNSTSGWVFNPLTTTSYTLVASQTTGATPCATTASVTVTVNQTPSVLTISPTPATVCIDTVLPLVTSGGSVGSTGAVQIGTGVLTNTITTPYKVFWGGSKTQALYTAAELSSLGLIAGSSIASIGHVILSGVPLLMNNYSVSVGFVSDATLGTAFIAGATNIVLNNVAFTPSTGAGNIDYTLTTPIVWDGVSNLLVETCFNNNDGGGSSTNSLSVQSSTVATGLNLYRSQDNTVDVCSNSTTPFGFTTRPNLRIFVLGQVFTTWLPITNLYTDAAATTPYTSGTSATTVYVKSSVGVPTINYTATATSVLGCARLATIPVTVYQTAAPTGLQFYQFCPTGGATVTSMTPVVNGTSIKWYSTATGGTQLPSTTALTQGYYWASQTLNGCESPTRFLVFAISNATAAPSSSPSQQFCNSATVANLTANGTAIQWYVAATGGTALASTAALATGTYYVSQTSGGCESPRTAVSVTVNAVSAPTGAATQSLSSLLTLGDIVVTGSNIVWYATAANAASGTSPLPSTQLLVNTTYYATQTINGCRSAASLAVTITTLANQDFDMTQFTYYPNPVIDLLNISYSQDMTSVKVFNIVGQQLMIKEINTSSTQIDMSGYANGAYFIQVTTENAMKTVRVIKK